MDIENILNNNFRGCALIYEKKKNILKKAFGYADVPNKVKNHLDTKFATASAGKVFVAVGILQLIEKGILHFEDRIGEIFDFELNQINSNITVEQLLNHTSGIPDYFDETVMNEYEQLWTDYPNYKIRSNKDIFPLFINKPMMYSPGSKFQYNNTGYVVLAEIIEKIAGMKFDIFLQDKVFKPCGMYSTGYYELDRMPAKCAINYIYDEKRDDYRTNIFSVDAKGTGAGGAFTTIGDIQLFWDCLLSYKLLSLTMTNNMLSNHSGIEECYGYGIWLKNCNGCFIPYFQGSDPGVSFISSYDIKKQRLIVLISNFGDNVWKLLREIYKN